MSAAPSVRELLSTGRQRLAAAGIASPEADARTLLAAAAEVEPAQLLMRDALPAAAADRYEAMLVRREHREPVQHITGVVDFRHVRLRVGPGVFVPRPETELMAGWAIDQLRALESPRPVVADLGSGSGAIAAAIADEVPSAAVYATELDEPAADWAASNLAGTEVELRVADMAEALADLDRTVDLVVCNPPYVPLTAWETVEPEARDHDPQNALFSGPDGLDAIRELSGIAARLLRPGGWVCCEHAEVQEAAALAVFSGQPSFEQVRDHRDYNDRPRFVTARRTTDPPGHRLG